MRIEALGIRARAPVPAADVRDAHRREPQPREPEQIRLPTPARIRLDARVRGAILLQELLAHFVAYREHGQHAGDHHGEDDSEKSDQSGEMLALAQCFKLGIANCRARAPYPEAAF